MGRECDRLGRRQSAPPPVASGASDDTKRVGTSSALVWPARAQATAGGGPHFPSTALGGGSPGLFTDGLAGLATGEWGRTGTLLNRISAERSVTLRIHDFMIRTTTWVMLGGLVLFVGTLIGLADAGRCQALYLEVGRIPAGDKIAHCVLFGTMAFLANTALNGGRLQLGAFTVLRGSLFVLIPTILEEFSQLFFRSRTFDLLDILADVVGVTLGGCLALLLLRYLNLRGFRRGVPRSETGSAIVPSLPGRP